MDRAFHLKRKEDPGEGIRRIALGRADKVLEGLRSVSSSDDVSVTVHTIRKDLKKVRSVTRMVRDELGKKEYKSVDRLFKKAANKLSGSRDAEVKVQTLESMLEDHAEARVVGQKWLLDLKRERDQTKSETQDADAEWVDEAISNVEEAKARIEDWSLKIGPEDLIDDGMILSYRQGRKAMAKAEDNTTPGNLHDWRKRTKDLWYQIRILNKTWPDVVGLMADEAHDLTDLLGDRHDFDVLADDLAERDFPNGDRDVLKAALKDFRRELAEDAFELGAKIYTEKPKDLKRRMRRYWKLWRSK
jgi:CHAD domain-containing protein